MTSTFYVEARSGDRVWVTTAAVKIERRTFTSNPHQSAKKWYIVARPKDSVAYAAKKVASGEWTAVDQGAKPEDLYNAGVLPGSAS